MFKRLAVFSALAIGCAAVAHADTIAPGSYLVQTGGQDQFTSNTITFTPGTAQIAAINGAGGTFATYLSGGNPVTFLPGTNPYTQGTNISSPGGSLQLFSVTGGGETFTFFIQSYSAQYGSFTGCASGDTCLNITGNGYFTGSGVHTYDASSATFQFDSSYVPGQSVGSVTSFAAQASTLAATPEPASLALLGTGLLGVFGVARKRFARV